MQNSGQRKTKISGKLIGLLLLIGFILSMLFIYGGKSYFQPEQLKLILLGNKRWSPVIFILLNSIRSFVLIPASLLSISAGAVFGAFKGGVYTIIGQTISAGLAFGTARYFARDYVEKILAKKLGNKIQLVKKIEKQKGFKTVFLLRLLPVVPFDLVSYGVGLSEIRLSAFLLATILATIPSSFVYTYLGSSLTDWKSRKFLYPLGILIFTAGVSSAYYYFRRVKNKKAGGQ